MWNRHLKNLNIFLSALPATKIPLVPTGPPLNRGSETTPNPDFMASDHAETEPFVHNIALYAGTSAAAIFLLGAVVGIVVCLVRRRHNARTPNTSNPNRDDRRTYQATPAKNNKQAGQVDNRVYDKVIHTVGTPKAGKPKTMVKTTQLTSQKDAPPSYIEATAPPARPAAIENTYERYEALTPPYPRHILPVHFYDNSEGRPTDGENAQHDYIEIISDPTYEEIEPPKQTAIAAAQILDQKQLAHAKRNLKKVKK